MEAGGGGREVALGVALLGIDEPAGGMRRAVLIGTLFGPDAAGRGGGGPAARPVSSTGLLFSRLD